MSTVDQPILSQLMPFNRYRFDACISYLANQGDRHTLTQYEIMKLHVMIDIFHVLEHGSPVIGGTLRACANGPMVERAHDHVWAWYKQSRELGEHPFFHITKGTSKKRYHEPIHQIADADDFSPSELEAMKKAWDLVVPMNFGESQKYFHKTSFVGKAWEKAKQHPDREVSWDDIIEEYEQETGKSLPHIRRAIRF